MTAVDQMVTDREHALLQVLASRIARAERELQETVDAMAAWGIEAEYMPLTEVVRLRVEQLGQLRSEVESRLSSQL